MTLYIFLRTFVEPARQLSFDAGERVRTARFRRLILVGRPTSIHGHLHTGQRDGGLICGTTSFAAAKSARATTPTTVSVKRDGVELCLTVRYNGRRNALPESDRSESQQLIR